MVFIELSPFIEFREENWSDEDLRRLQNWEQHRTQPTGPAKALLKIVASDPRAIEALHD